MTITEYLKQGKIFFDMGYATDGCSFIGWLMSDKYTPACHSHDYGRAGLIKFDEEGDNDNLFRSALHFVAILGALVLFGLIYWHSRS